MRTTVIASAAELAALEPAWWDLLGRVPGAPPFMAPAWLLPWWDVFAPGTLHTVAVWNGERLAALAPLYTEEGPWGRRLLPLGLGLSDLLDVLVDPAMPGAASALTRALAGNPGRWDAWSAEEAPEGAAVLALPVPPGWTADTAAQSACPMLRLAAGPDGGATLPARKARKLRMARHRTARRDAVLAAATPASLQADLDSLFALHAARWQSRGEPGVLGHEAVQRFHRLAAPRLLATGLLDVRGLRIAGEVAGIYYGLRNGGTRYAYLGGFDPAFAFESPGTVLIGHAIDEAWAQGATAFSFLRGQEGYKYEWGAVDCWSRRRTFRPPPR